MKTLTLTIFFACIALTGFSQDTTKTTKPTKQKPKTTYQVGNAKVIVWENTKPDGSISKNFQVVKVYRKGKEWKTTNSFNSTELLELKEAIDKAIIAEAIK